MTTPINSTTTDEGRYYEWPGLPGQHLPSITTIIKQGVPAPVLHQWAVKKVAVLALEQIDTLIELQARAAEAN